MEQLTGMAQSYLAEQMNGNPQVQHLGVNPQQVASVASESILDMLGDQLKGGDTSGVQEMLSGQDTTPDNPAVNSLVPGVASQLGSRLNLPPGSAQALAVVAIPLILNMLNGRVGQARQGGTDIGGLLGGLLGGGGATAGGMGGGGGLLGGLLGGMMGGGTPQPHTQPHAQPRGGSGRDLLSSVLGGLFK